MATIGELRDEWTLDITGWQQGFEKATQQVKAMASFKRSVVFGGNGRVLTDLLIKAAGLGKGVTSLSCHCKPGHVITFDVELQADDDKIGEALREVDVTTITEGVTRKEMV